MLLRGDEIYILASGLQHSITLSCLLSVQDCIRPVLHIRGPGDCELAHLELVELSTLRLVETSKGYPGPAGVLQKRRLRKG
jgi:hypothetical protein